MYYPVKEYSTVSSTNSEALSLVESGERGPVWLRADCQKSGRGRSGRSWHSPFGNLYTTLLFSLSSSAGFTSQLSLVAGLAVYDTIIFFIQNVHPERAYWYLKWPNDLMVGKAKIGGILVETVVAHGEYLAIIGCGVNIKEKPINLGREVAAMIEYGSAPHPKAFLEKLDSKLHYYLRIWNNGMGFAAIREDWLKRSFPLGTYISIKASNSLVYGNFAGLGNDGSLLLKQSDGEIKCFNFGEVGICETFMNVGKLGL
ncbi:MAG: Bifunctional ligase/repressor BirA [Hyphomicrobiaceae bacterium hypho_1]